MDLLGAAPRELEGDPFADRPAVGLGHVLLDGQAAALEVGDAPRQHLRLDHPVVGRRVDPDELLGGAVELEGAESDPDHRGQLRLVGQAGGQVGAERREGVVHQDVVGGDRPVEGLGGGGLDRGGEDAHEGDQGQPDHQGGGGGGGAARVAHGVLAGQGAGQPERLGERPADQPGQRPGDQRAEDGHAEEHDHRARGDVDQPVALVLEQPGQQQGDPDEGHEHAEHDPALAEVGGRERGLGLEGGHGRDPGRLAGRQQRRQQGDDDADGQRHDHRAPEEHGAGGRQVEVEDPGEQRLEAVGDQHPEAEADQGGDHGDDQRLEQHRGHHLAPAGPQAAQQGQLAGPLGDDDGEGVEDQERAHQQGHEGEGEQRGRQEAAEGVVDGAWPRPRTAPRR